MALYGHFQRPSYRNYQEDHAPVQGRSDLTEFLSSELPDTCLGNGGLNLRGIIVGSRY